MAMTLPMPLVGRHITNATLTPLTISATGTITNGTVAVVSGVSVKTGLTFNINPVKEGASPYKLYEAIQQSDFLKLAVVVGTGASQRTVNFYGSRGDWTWNSTGKGRIVETIRLDSIDTGTGADAPFQIS